MLTVTLLVPAVLWLRLKKNIFVFALDVRYQLVLTPIVIRSGPAHICIKHQFADKQTNAICQGESFS